MSLFDLDHWREIGAALASNKLRTALTAFGVFWGIFMLMVMLGSGNGLENGVERGFSDGATNSFFVWARSTSEPYKGLPRGRRLRLGDEDWRALERQIASADVVAPRLQLGGFRGGNNVLRGERSGAFSVMGDVPEFRDVENLRIDRGRFVNALDIERERKVAIIGERVRQVLFEPGEDPIGESIRINGVMFKVVGLHRPRVGGEGDDPNDAAQTIHVPLTTFQRAFNQPGRIHWFAVTSAPGVRASVTEREVLDLLKRRHRVAPDDRRAFGHYNVEEEYLKIQGLFLGIRTLIWIVGTGTLAAGVIGVSNIMLVIVRERTKEIGVRRALGATPMSIRAQVILESVLLTAGAGYLGLILGMVVVDAVDALIDRSGGAGMFADPAVGLVAALQALAILIGSGVVAGWIPAERAVAVRPVEALRMET